MKNNWLTKAFVPGYMLLALPGCTPQPSPELPNILWITSEDNSPIAGCYGDKLATTPHMDRLAESGFLYTHAYANAPVCAPARNTILTGMYASSTGNSPMRSRYSKSDVIKPLPTYLREAGYYTTNNAKEDYNLPAVQTECIWDESSNTAHYRNRPEGKPFFAVFNIATSHESSLHQRTPAGELRHHPDSIALPPYHPDTPDMRHDWAQYYDKIEDMDLRIGQILQELHDSGLAENTLVFYFGDHGGALARSKRFLYETGTRVPFIVHIPQKYKHLYPERKPGAEVNRMISFVDLVPTMLSLLGIDPPGYLQGNPFLGKYASANPEYAFMFRDRMDERYDMSRAVRSEQYRLIRNYLPYRPQGQHLEYLWLAPSVRSWEEAFLSGNCNPVQSRFWLPKPAIELYDTANDPWEVNNLANLPEYAEIQDRLESALEGWILDTHDAGFIPEADLQARVEGMAVYDFMQLHNLPMEAISKAARVSAAATVADLELLKEYLNHPEPAVQFWGASGLLQLGIQAESAAPDLIRLLERGSPQTKIVAAEALYTMGFREEAVAAWLPLISEPNEMVQCYALNSIANQRVEDQRVVKAVVNIVVSQPGGGREKYDLRMAKSLILGWKLDMQQHNIVFAW